ncbi:hypothetical protein RAS1_19490 [Phycisphaerae bacterium RAS1]|nr:hypothetical protein RAS1_19490 [Phycisphaerae bacterium RAS1]
MKLRRSVFPIVLGLGVCVSEAQVPPGYRIVQLMYTPDQFDRTPSINNCGQVVFCTRFDPNDWNTGEIMLYEDGKFIRLTNDNVRDDAPDINDAGTIVWHRGIGPNGTAEIVMLKDGELKQITDDAWDDQVPRINQAGQIAWYQRTGAGCASSESNVMFFDGETIHTIVADGESNQWVRLNDYDELVWTRFNFCQSPWTSEQMLYSGGVITQLTAGQVSSASPDINNAGDVAWFHRVPPDYHHAIDVWRAGVTTRLTEWGSGVRIGNNGDVFFDRWHDDTQTWQVWLYREGTYFQLSDDPFWNYVFDLNDRGELVWHSGDPFTEDIRALLRYSAGDLNCDGSVNTLDIGPFVTALIDPQGYAAEHPSCDAILADTNGDGQANVLDINGFIDLIMRGSD